MFGKNKGYGRVLTEKRVVKALLNLIMGCSEDSRILWKVLTLHSQIIFGEGIERSEMHKGYFFLALEYQLGVRIHPKYAISAMFNKNDFIEAIDLVSKIKIAM